MQIPQADAHACTGLHSVIHGTPPVSSELKPRRSSVTFPIYDLLFNRVFMDGLLFNQVCLLHSAEGVELTAMLSSTRIPRREKSVAT